MTSSRTARPKVDWLVMLYIAADDKENARSRAGTLTDNCGNMLRKLLALPFDQQVAIVALTDSPYDTATAQAKDVLSHQKQKVYEYMTPAVRVRNEQDWAAIEPRALPKGIFSVAEGEQIRSGGYQTLAAFCNWALEKYDANKTMLAIIGHGGGWAPGFPEIEPLIITPINDDTPEASYLEASALNRSRSPKISFSRVFKPVPDASGWMNSKGANGSPCPEGLCPDYSPAIDGAPYVAMSTRGLRAAFEEGLGGRQLDVLFLDACLTGMAEVAYEIKEHAHYMIASEDLLYVRLPYHLYLRDLRGKTPEQLAQTIVKYYNEEDPLDPSARPLVQKSWEIAAIDLHKMDGLRDEIDGMAKALLDVLRIDPRMRSAIRGAYLAAQKFDYDADVHIEERTEGYVDLFDFADKLVSQLRDAASNRDDEKLYTCIQAASAHAEQIMRTIGEGYETLTPKSGDIVHIIQKGLSTEDQAASDGAVVYCRAQTEKDSLRKLYQAHGISIYLPLGETDERHKSDPEIAQLFGRTSYLDFYANQLRFTDRDSDRDPDHRQPTQWLQLIQHLVRNMDVPEIPIRDLKIRPYRLPRLLQ